MPTFWPEAPSSTTSVYKYQKPTTPIYVGTWDVARDMLAEDSRQKRLVEEYTFRIDLMRKHLSAKDEEWVVVEQPPYLDEEWVVVEQPPCLDDEWAVEECPPPCSPPKLKRLVNKSLTREMIKKQLHVQ